MVICSCWKTLPLRLIRVKMRYLSMFWLLMVVVILFVNREQLEHCPYLVHRCFNILDRTQIHLKWIWILKNRGVNWRWLTWHFLTIDQNSLFFGILLQEFKAVHFRRYTQFWKVSLSKLRLRLIIQSSFRSKTKLLYFLLWLCYYWWFFLYRHFLLF